MIYLDNNAFGSIVLNINNNLRTAPTTYKVTLTHVMSQQSYDYTVDCSNASEYTSNDRYCTLIVPIAVQYDGQYQMKIYFNGTTLVYTGIVEIGDVIETFPEYTSDNEDGESYIYLED